MEATTFKQRNFMLRKPEKAKSPFKLLASLTAKQWLIFLASFMGWTLDAFDFFLVTFAIEDISKQFNRTTVEITGAITITLMTRPLGALIFGVLADRYGRKIPLLVDILLYSLMGVLTGFSNNYAAFMSYRAIFGIAMGGEWGLGAAIAMESLPVKTRGLFSGILQQGYAFGYLLAAVFFYLIYPAYGWRALFWFSSIPAFMCIVVRLFMPESHVKEQTPGDRSNNQGSWFKDVFIKSIRENWKTLIYCVVLMSCFNFLSHGSQDLFPTFLRTELGYSTGLTTLSVVISNIGAIIGGISLGYVSEFFGRKRTMVISCLLAGCFIPLWILTPHNVAALCTGAFLVQFFVQGAWGTIPAYLNELSPNTIRGTFPGVVYQLGNLVASSTSQIESKLAEKFKLPNSNIPNYGVIQGVFVGVVLFLTIVAVSFGPERKGQSLNINIGNENLENEIQSPDLEKGSGNTK